MAISTKIVSLAKFLDGGFSKSGIRKAFSRFSCEHDPGVSLFLKAHAIQNEDTGASRTCLALSSEAFDQDRLEAVTFMAIAVTVTDNTDIYLGCRRPTSGGHGWPS